VTFAYLDPGAGSLAIQMIIAAALAVPYFLRTQIARGINRLRGQSSGTRASEQPSPEE
jgi:hypothetical protein